MHWANICEIITIQTVLYVILLKILDGKVTKLFAVCPILSIIMLLTLEYFQYNDILFFVCDILFYFVFPVIFVRGIKKTTLLYTSTVIVGLFSLVNVSASFITAFINPEFSRTNLVNIIIELLLAVIVICLAVKRKLSVYAVKYVFTSRRTKIIFAVFIWELVVLFSLLAVLFLNFTVPAVMALSCFILILILVISCFAFYLMIANDLKASYYQKLNQTFQNTINEQVKLYEQLSQKNSDLRKFRHDLQNLAIGLKSYLNKQDYDGAVSYLNDCSQILENDGFAYHTGHSITDAILSEKSGIGKEYNIEIIFNGILPQNSLSDAELCVIFGNTLDNAIEACIQIGGDDKKTITVTVRQNRDFVFITIVNPTASDVKIINNTILSTKKNNNLHGIGLSSVKQILQNHNGHLNLKYEYNLFTAEMDFCIY